MVAASSWAVKGLVNTAAATRVNGSVRRAKKHRGQANRLTPSSYRHVLTNQTRLRQLLQEYGLAPAA